MNIRTTGRRAVRIVAATSLLALIGLAPAAAEGPGYGGTADQLAVAWVDSSAVTPSADGPVTIGGGRGAAVIVVADGQPSMAPDSQRLQVNGLGFRARSEVSIRIGDGAPVTSRSDTAGSLDVAIDPELLGGTQPGLTVVAIGRAPSGTAVTLYGSVPPKANGAGPMGLVPWLALSVATGGLALWLRARHRRHAVSLDAGTTDGAGMASPPSYA